MKYSTTPGCFPPDAVLRMMDVSYNIKLNIPRKTLKISLPVMISYIYLVMKLLREKFCGV